MRAIVKYKGAELESKIRGEKVLKIMQVFINADKPLGTDELRKLTGITYPSAYVNSLRKLYNIRFNITGTAKDARWELIKGYTMEIVK